MFKIQVFLKSQFVMSFVRTDMWMTD